MTKLILPPNLSFAQREAAEHRQLYAIAHKGEVELGVGLRFSGEGSGILVLSGEDAWSFTAFFAKDWEMPTVLCAELPGTWDDVRVKLEGPAQLDRLAPGQAGLYRNYPGISVGIHPQSQATGAPNLVDLAELRLRHTNHQVVCGFKSIIIVHPFAQPAMNT